MRALPYLAAAALAIYCIVEIVQHSDARPYRLPKWAWVLIVVLLPFLGPAAWFFMKYVDPFGDEPAENEQGPRAPDDDTAYLKWLDERSKRRKGQGKGDKAT